MTAADYVATFVSIILGLALADLGASLHRLLRARGRVRWDYLAPMQALGATLAIVAGWWALYNDFGTRVSLWQFLPALLSLTLLFLLASAALPDHVPEEGLDLRAFYMDNRRYFWSIFAAFLVSTTAWDIGLMLSSRSSLSEAIAAYGWHIVFLPLAGLMIWSDRPWVHGVCLAAMLVGGTYQLNMAVGN